MLINFLGIKRLWHENMQHFASAATRFSALRHGVPSLYFHLASSITNG
jgi:uncharacterized membrane-anchored protein YhcB (DUF1043 family)